MPAVNARGAARSDEKHAASRPWWVYLLRCGDGTLYAGATNDLARRLRAHEAGRVKYTRGRLPVVVAWSERAGAKGAALSREAQVKRLRRAAKEALIAAFVVEGVEGVEAREHGG